MAEQLLPYALTTVARVKNRIAITVSSHDTVLQRLINAVTDYIESQTNRRFKATDYVEEIPVNTDRAKYLFLKHAPVRTLTSIEYRAGLYNNPNWTEVPATDWNLEGAGESGIVRINGYIFRGSDVARATYNAGYLIDFDNAGDNTNHTLPHDISDLCERIVVRIFKKREAEGKSSESVGQGGTINWAKDLDELDKETIEKYKRVPAFV